MVSLRCKMAVKNELQKMGLHFVLVDLGEAEVMENLTFSQTEELKASLLLIGLELMDDKKSVLIEKIKSAVIEMIHHTEEEMKINFSDYLSKKLDHDYTYLSNLFTEVQGITIAQFIIAHKIERIKELIIYDQMNISEIAIQMNYSSTAHLSNQFKKMTGLTPSQFKISKNRLRNPIENVGNETAIKIAGDKLKIHKGNG